MRSVHAVLWSSGIACLLVIGRSAHAQSQQPLAGIGSSISRAPDHRSSLDMSELSPSDQHKLDRGRQADRQRRMVADTDRLLALAAQLKTDLDKASGDPSAADVARKAAEIEKLARSVKDHMKG